MEMLKEQYEKEVVPALMKKFNYKSVMQVPRLEKIVINMVLFYVIQKERAMKQVTNMNHGISDMLGRI